MQFLAYTSVCFVVLLHIGFLILEMFLWDTSIGRKVFGTTPEFSSQSAVLAANQGLYNGFIAAGLMWSIARGVIATELTLFLLVFATIAGLYGAVTASRSILWLQALPSALALIFCFCL